MEEKENKQKIIQVNEISESTKKSFVKRLITAIVLCAICIPCMIFGNWAFIGLIIAISLVAVYEMLHVMKDKNHPIWLQIVVGIATLSFVFWIMIKNHASLLDANGNFTLKDITISTLALAALVCFTFFASMVKEKVSVLDVFYYVTMSLLIGMGLQSMLFIRFVPMSTIISSEGYTYAGGQFASCLLFTYVILGTFMTDIGAYTFGVLFGKHKMNPRISPNKTWEGFVGGIFCSLVSSMIFGIVSSFNGSPLLNGVLDHTHWYWILLISFVMPIVSTLGDFTFSAIKRQYKIKDFSNILPGHGGVLDRIDSLLVTSLVVSAIILTIAYFPFMGA